jgi:hypothetical protein
MFLSRNLRDSAPVIGSYTAQRSRADSTAASMRGRLTRNGALTVALRRF